MTERAEFAEFVAARSPDLLRAGWLLTGDWALAEDLVQTALAATWPHWATLVRTDRPEVYVRRVMVTTYLRWQRRRWRGEIATARLPESATSRGAGFDQVELRESLVGALDVLTPKQRAVIVLRYFADQPEAQVAQALGCSVGTVKSRAAQAMAKLRDVPGLADVLTGGGS